jgi:hypothetical protein
MTHRKRTLDHARQLTLGPSDQVTTRCPRRYGVLSGEPPTFGSTTGRGGGKRDTGYGSPGAVERNGSSYGVLSAPSPPTRWVSPRSGAPRAHSLASLRVGMASAKTKIHALAHHPLLFEKPYGSSRTRQLSNAELVRTKANAPPPFYRKPYNVGSVSPVSIDSSATQNGGLATRRSR